MFPLRFNWFSVNGPAVVPVIKIPLSEPAIIRSLKLAMEFILLFVPVITLWNDSPFVEILKIPLFPPVSINAPDVMILLNVSPGNEFDLIILPVAEMISIRPSALAAIKFSS
jgi:hypothetical protein